MRAIPLKLFIPLGIFFAVTAFAATRYVDLTASAIPPFTSWATAATNIQQAIDVGDPGDEIVVTNGVYGGGTAPGLTNRITVTKPLMVRSVEGPSFTVIQGLDGTNALRCVYLCAGATLDGFTLINGSGQGGGALCESTNAALLNCLIRSNQSGAAVYSGFLSNCVVEKNRGTGLQSSFAIESKLLNNFIGATASTLIHCELRGNTNSGNGGGASGGILRNCIIAQNQAYNGAGAYSAKLINCSLYKNYANDAGGGAFLGSLTGCAVWGNGAGDYAGGAYGADLTNCTVVGNSALTYGGGIQSGTTKNCILYKNFAPVGANHWPEWGSSAVLYSCNSPLLAGTGNIDIDPQLASINCLSSSSPCASSGNSLYASGVDIDGEAWASPPSMGCDQFISGSATGSIAVAIEANYTNVVAGLQITFVGLIEGRVSSSRWEFDNGIVSNQPIVSRKWQVPGDYNVVLRAFNASFPDGIASTTTVHVVSQPVHYVRSANLGKLYPYTSWATAAAEIQEAVDAAVIPGSLVLVSNGTYATGGRVYTGNLKSRVVITNATVLESVNGPAVTTIVGDRINFIRGVHLGTDGMLSGFTITNGAMYAGSADYDLYYESGGGVFCESQSSVVTNCVITGNTAAAGAGVLGGTVTSSLIFSNAASDMGGGAAFAKLNYCVVKSNYASSVRGGGGVYGGMMNSCLVISNNSGNGFGGGASLASVMSCTVVGNFGNGLLDCAVTNSIVYYNSPQNFSTFQNPPQAKVFNCCRPGVASGGNFGGPPSFVNLTGGDFRLLSNSIGIHDGYNPAVWGDVDLDGNPRIVGTAVDVGAYECQNPVSQIPSLWLLQYGIAINASTDANDGDGDGMGNWAEWRTGTVPTNATSVLKMLSATHSSNGSTVTWQSVSGRKYFLERANAVGSLAAFETIATNILAIAETKAFADSSATNSASYFYRIGAE